MNQGSISESLAASLISRSQGRCVSFRVLAMLAATALMGTAASLHGQASEPTLFVGNNGNLEGSISSLTIETDGSLTLNDVIVTGTRDSTSEPCPGCNVYTLDISPDGRYLVAGHPSSSNFPLHVSVTRVNDEGTLELITLHQVPNSPLDVVWLDDDYFAVTSTSLTNSFNQVRVYRYNRDSQTVTFANNDFTGGFTTSLAVDRENKLLFSQRTSPTSAVRAYSYNDSGQLTFLQMLETDGTYPLGIGLSPDGTGLYGGGGISSGGDKIIGIEVDTDAGSMSPMAGSPFISPGASPKQVVVAGNGQTAIVGHGTDATVRTFDIDPRTGALSPTGHFFDVGFQGSLGDIATAGDLVFATDNTTAIDGIKGAYSFTLGSQGQLFQNGPIVDTDGISPRALAPWIPATCPGDFNDDGVIDSADLLVLLAAWGLCDGCEEDLNDDGVVDGADLLTLLAIWGACP